MNRDDELDDLEKDLNAPYIHEPDVKEPDPVGLTCFLDCVRVCAPDCMAYNHDELDSKGVLVQGASRCLILYNCLEQVTAMQVATLANRRKIVEAQDAVRRTQSNVPDPYGKNK